MPPDGATEPLVEVVIPVHNEAGDLLNRIDEIQEALDRAGVDRRVLLVENGSTDDTWSLAQRLESQGSVRALRSPVADYGAALRLGVHEAKAPILALAEIDFCDAGFIRQAVALLEEQVDLVQSSKACKGAVDRRPLLRRAITRGFNLWLRLSLGFEGTDTHGMKVARRDVLDSLMAECVLDGNLLATEIVIRAQRRGLTVRELPVSIRETRESAVGVFDRVPSTFRDMSRLRRALRVTGRSR
jgi:glycosyltransferase involved in cell wall biosynthesis